MDNALRATRNKIIKLLISNTLNTKCIPVVKTFNHSQIRGSLNSILSLLLF